MTPESIIGLALVAVVILWRIRAVSSWRKEAGQHRDWSHEQNRKWADFDTQKDTQPAGKGEKPIK